MLRTMKDYASKLAKLKEKLAAYEDYEKQILTTGRVFRVRNGEDSREMESWSLADVRRAIDETETKIDQLEDLIGGRSSNGMRIRAR